MLHIRKVGKDLSGLLPVEGTHWEMVVGTLTDSELLFEILKGIESVRGIELLVIFAVRALDFAIVSGCANTNQLVANAKLTESLFKESFSVYAA